MKEFNDDIFLEDEDLDAEEQCTAAWRDYENARQYQANIGIAHDIPKFVDFFEGRQWAPATENTKFLPRPVVNLIKMIVRNKSAAILSTPVRLVYSTDQTVKSELIRVFNDFANYMVKEMRQEEIDDECVRDGAVKGTYVYHYYWDSEAQGKDGTIKGGLRVEKIDPLNIFFSNPTETDEQRQKWVMISSREDVSSVRARADEDVNLDEIQPDENDDYYYSEEQEESGLVTVLTKYFRQDGEVYCLRATKGTVINKPFPITPRVDGEKNAYRATLYPVVVGSYDRREKSIYGIGEVEGLIPNQQAINFLFAMQTLETQELGWGKYVVRPDALRGQRITNEPGQVLTDYSADGKGISRMDAPTFTNMPLTLIQNLMDATRVVTGSTEVMTGETLSGQMSGAAIAQLQSQAQLPIEHLQKRFWRVKEKQGKVLEQAFKLYYEGETFPTHNEDSSEKVKTEQFNGSEYASIELDVVVEATAGVTSSTAGDIALLDTLLARGAIDESTYVDAYPQNAVSNKARLLEAIHLNKATNLQAVTEQLQQAQAETTQLLEMLKSNKKVVDDAVVAIQEVSRLKKLIAELYAEAKTKIDAANTENQTVKQDATHFAEMIANEIGLGQNTTV